MAIISIPAIDDIRHNNVINANIGVMMAIKYPNTPNIKGTTINNTVANKIPDVTNVAILIALLRSNKGITTNNIVTNKIATIA